MGEREEAGGKAQEPGLGSVVSGCRMGRVRPLLMASEISTLDNVPTSFLRAGLLYGYRPSLILKCLTAQVMWPILLSEVCPLSL